jgi:glycosyltransferase involved in cell wall biosynthesis
VNLRIAYLLESTELCGGVKVVLLQADVLARRGHRVTIVCPRPAEPWISFERAAFELSSFSDSTEIACADILVATFWTTVGPAVAAGPAPVFHLCQGYEADFAFYAHLRTDIESAYRLPTHKLAITRTLAEKLRSKGHGPVTYVGQAFDPRDYRPADLRDVSVPIVLLVGSYAADVKGIDVAFEGLRRWRLRGGGFRLRRVSTDPPTAFEQASGIVDEYHRRLEPSRMPHAYRASDLLIGPSRPEEGFGLPVVEALASGLPCVLSDTPTHREIAGDVAWYFSDGDPESLAEALPRAETAEARRRSRTLGPEVAARFSAASVAERLERAFIAAVEERERSQPRRLQPVR